MDSMPKQILAEIANVVEWQKVKPDTDLLNPDPLRPRSLGQASRISGITPAALSVLQIHLKKRGLI